MWLDESMPDDIYIRTQQRRDVLSLTTSLVTPLNLVIFGDAGCSCCCCCWPADNAVIVSADTSAPARLLLLLLLFGAALLPLGSKTLPLPAALGLFVGAGSPFGTVAASPLSPLELPLLPLLLAAPLLLLCRLCCRWCTVVGAVGAGVVGMVVLLVVLLLLMLLPAISEPLSEVVLVRDWARCFFRFASVVPASDWSNW